MRIHGIIKSENYCKKMKERRTISNCVEVRQLQDLYKTKAMEQLMPIITKEYSFMRSVKGWVIHKL